MPSINSNTGAIYSVNASREADREMSTAMKRLSSGIELLMQVMTLQALPYLIECYHKLKAWRCP